MRNATKALSAIRRLFIKVVYKGYINRYINVVGRLAALYGAGGGCRRAVAVLSSGGGAGGAGGVGDTIATHMEDIYFWGLGATPRGTKTPFEVWKIIRGFI